MIEEPNDTDKPKLPTIKVSWDHVAQNVGIELEPTEIKNWPFAAMVLQAAADHAKNMATTAAMQHAQAKMMEAQQAQRISNQLSRGNGPHPRIR